VRFFLLTKVQVLSLSTKLIEISSLSLPVSFSNPSLFSKRGRGSEVTCGKSKVGFSGAMTFSTMDFDRVRDEGGS
jgi:hypothetical protein